jgi:cellobiose phosphorylase
MVISGLEDIGRNDLAAELNWSTIKIFTGRYAEYLEPSVGEPHGVQRYGWTASQYIQAIIEHLFGIDYNGVKKILTVRPHIPEELRGLTVGISNLKIPSEKGIRIMVDIHTDKSGKYDVRVDAGKETPDFKIEII